MRELVLKISMSLDGFASDLEGRNAWTFGDDPEAAAWEVETISDASLHIMGSRTFHDMAAFWPTSTEVFAPPMNLIPKAVFSRRGPAFLDHPKTSATFDEAHLHAGDTRSAHPQPGAESWKTPYVASGDLAEEIARLKARDGRPIIAHGGAGFARSLVATGLIDRYALLVCPVALGRGMPLFADLPAHLPLRLVSSRAFPGGAVAQVYRPG